MPLRLSVFILVLFVSFFTGRFIINDFVSTALILYGQDEASHHLAVGYYGGNPETKAALARFLLYRAEPARPADAAKELQRAVWLSPRDFRYHLELGRALEMNGDVANAESEFQKVVGLAPAHFESHWTLANFFLRAGKNENAVQSFRRALELSGGGGTPDRNAALSAYAALASLLANNPETLQRITPPDAASQSYAAAFLADTGSLDAAITLWQQLPPDEPASYRSLIFRLLDRAQSAGRFRDAQAIWQKFLQMESEKLPFDFLPSPPGELIFNPGFEKPFIGDKYPDMAFAKTGFDWIVRPHPEVRVRRDAVTKHSGEHSLHLTFNALMRSEFREASQLIPVEPARSYRLKFFARTERLPESDAPFVELRDAASGGTFNARLSLPGESNDWRELRLEFTTPKDIQAVRLTICSPIQTRFSAASPGELWLDDFSVESLTPGR
jgi:cytochrome c-type biogenesis protein CcmH/NrfG